MFSTLVAAAGLAAAIEPDAVFTVHAEGQRNVVRVVTRDDACPNIRWDEGLLEPMALRAAKAVVPKRSGGAQVDSKEAEFGVTSCEATWPAGVRRAFVGKLEVPAPKAEIQRIVIVADTGCRMKASENAFQACNDEQKWPFATVAQSAARLKPDLVIHIGDIHYRESPCPAGNDGCRSSAWGYGYDAWLADFFMPAMPLLSAAPWVFVRGNHESCSRAGQGWFRFIDAQPWSSARSCDDPALDREADYSEPYAVPLSQASQLIVFDSSKTSGKPFGSNDLAFIKYSRQLEWVAQAAGDKENSFFLSHHPLLAVAPGVDSQPIKSAGNQGLLSVFGARFPQRLFPHGVSVAMHGHVHMFESLSFRNDVPASLVLGNSGSVNEGSVPTTLPAGSIVSAHAEIEDYAATAEFGFTLLERETVQDSGVEEWRLTEFSASGRPNFECKITETKSRCRKR